MPKIHVEEQILIQQSPAKIYAVISDYHHWQQWSPWLLAEPESDVSVSETGDFYSWEGKIIGSGQMTITKKSPSFDFLAMDLQFLKPWKSQAKVAFYLEEQDEGTLLRWTMDSRLPFFLFWMKKSTVAFIGEDYQRGLRLLKDVVETGKTHSTITFEGMKQQPELHYLGIRRTISSKEISTYMSKDYEYLMPLYHRNWKSLQAGPPFSIYHNFDMVNKKVEYTAAVPLTEIPAAVPEGLIQGKLPEMAVYSILHEGPYRHVANAWSAGYMHLRAKKFPSLGKFSPMEVYWNSPKDTPELELKSEIRFPAKG